MTTLFWKMIVGISVVAALLGLCGCGQSRSARSSVVGSTPVSFVSKVERACGVMYEKPRPRGKALGFICGEGKDKRAHFGGMFTRRVGCPLFITLVDSAKYRAQGCIGLTTTRPEGRLTCLGKMLTIWARVLARARTVNVKLSTGEISASKILSLNSAAQAHWGGAYFDVLMAKKLSANGATGVLVERDGRGSSVGGVVLTARGCGSLR